MTVDRDTAAGRKGGVSWRPLHGFFGQVAG